MYLARVTGTVVSTIKADGLTAQKLLLIQPLNAAGQMLPRALVALDAVGAGVGETVYYCRSKESTLPFLPALVPTDATIVGIADPASNDWLRPEARS